MRCYPEGKVWFFYHFVCPAWASGIEDTKLFMRVKTCAEAFCRLSSVSLMCGDLLPEALVSRPVFYKGGLL